MKDEKKIRELADRIKPVSISAGMATYPIPKEELLSLIETTKENREFLVEISTQLCVRFSVADKWLIYALNAIYAGITRSTHENTEYKKALSEGSYYEEAKGV
jgi:hypothetical protein